MIPTTEFESTHHRNYSTNPSYRCHPLFSVVVVDVVRVIRRDELDWLRVGIGLGLISWIFGLLRLDLEAPIRPEEKETINNTQRMQERDKYRRQKVCGSLTKGKFCHSVGRKQVCREKAKNGHQIIYGEKSTQQSVC